MRGNEKTRDVSRVSGGGSDRRRSGDLSIFSLFDGDGRPTASGVAWVRANLGRTCACPIDLGGGRWAKCKKRSFYECPHCALTYRRDWSHIIWDGVRDVVGRVFFVTVTAPSFGEVHRVPKKREQVGTAGWRCPCGRWHKPEQGFLRGVAVDVDGYDYLGQVAWNAAFGRLWNVTLTALRRRLPEFEVVMVREWQGRGVLHGHALLRFGLGVDGGLVEEVVRGVVGSVRSGQGAEEVGWGERVDVQEVAVGEGARDVVGYVGKVVGYVAKDLVGAGVVSGSGGVRGLFFERLAEAAGVLPCGPGCRGAECGNRRHMNYGAAACVVSCTRASKHSGRVGWSVNGLTRRGEIEKRKEYAAQLRAGSGPTLVRVRGEMMALACERAVSDAALARERETLAWILPLKVLAEPTVAAAEVRVAEAEAHDRQVHEDTGRKLAVWRALYDERQWVTPPEGRGRLLEMLAYHRKAYRLGVVATPG